MDLVNRVSKKKFGVEILIYMVCVYGINKDASDMSLQNEVDNGEETGCRMLNVSKFVNMVLTGIETLS